jgi:hypothetical protein
MARRQGRYWFATIPADSWTPPEVLPPGVAYIKGQKEIGERTGYEHWQLVIGFNQKKSRTAVQSCFPRLARYELSRSAAANEYVFKDETAVPGTRFELGLLPMQRNEPRDWESIWNLAKSGDFEAIPADVRTRCFGQITKIYARYVVAAPVLRTCHVFWGATGTGKSRRAWAEAGLEAYPKDPLTKWFNGYTSQEHIVIDEFRGIIQISHLLRWLDRYPVLVETKGGFVPLRATQIWITSNLNPREWYPDLDEETRNALLRRLTITEFPKI